MAEFNGFSNLNNNFVDYQQNINNLELSAKNFDLSENEFDELLTSLKNGDTALFKTIFLAHSADCINFLQIKYNANYNDAYDAMVDTLINYRQRLVDDKISYGNIRFLFLQMASQHYLRMMRSQSIITSEEPDVNLESEDSYEDNYNEEQLEVLSKAWEGLNEECRKILKMNFYNGLKLNEIAEKLNKSHVSIRKQKERCKEALIKLFNENLI